MCSLYTMVESQAGAARIARAIVDRNNNQPPQPGIYPNYGAPVIVVGEDDHGGRPRPLLSGAPWEEVKIPQRPLLAGTLQVLQIGPRQDELQPVRFA